MVDLGPPVGGGPDEAMPLFIALGNRVNDGKVVEQPATDGKDHAGPPPEQEARQLAEALKISPAVGRRPTARRAGRQLW